MYPYQVEQVVFGEADADATVALKDELKACPLKVVEIVTDGFSGTLDIQGGINGAVTMDNVAYNLMGQDGPQSTVNNQLSFTADSARYRYQVSEPYAIMQAVMTRTAGTISVYVYGWAMAVGGGGGSTGGSVDVTSIAAGDNNIGNVDIASIAAGDNNIGNVDVASVAAGTNLIGKVGIDQTTPGTTNAVAIAPARNGGVLHRDAITAVDKLTMGALTVTDSNVIVGALTAVPHSVAVVANTAHGPTTPQTGSLTPDTAGGSQAIRIAWTAVTGAVSYDIYCSITSVDSGKWVGRVTAAQHATGGQISVIATGYEAGGTAGAIDIAVVGNGLVQGQNPTAYNNAYYPTKAGLVAIDCANKTTAKVKVTVVAASWSALPTLSLIPFFGNQVSATEWHHGTKVDVALLTGLGQGLCQEFEVSVVDEPEFEILIDAMTNLTSVSIWVELV